VDSSHPPVEDGWFPVREDRQRSGVHRVQDARLDLLHVDVARGLDARVAQGPLGILERAVVLQVASERPPRITWNVMRLSGISSFLAIGRTSQRRKFFPQRGTALPFRSPRQKVGNMRALGDESGLTAFHASIIGRTCSGTPIGARLDRFLNRPG
jgi:hypothetical protein